MTQRERNEVAEHAITYTDPVSGLSAKIYGALPREEGRMRATPIGYSDDCNCLYCNGVREAREEDDSRRQIEVGSDEIPGIVRACLSKAQQRDRKSPRGVYAPLP